jgi:hypothetical protein
VRDRWLPVWLALIAALAVAPGEWVGSWARDALGWIVPARSMPVVVVEVETSTDPVVAVGAARAAGADSVWAALPVGHPALSDAAPDPGTLSEGAGDRVRFDQGRRLPLPEAARSLLHVPSTKLAGAPPSFLKGKSVVLVFDDPAFGVPARIPAFDGIVDRGLPLAVAVGAQSTGRYLWSPPWAVVVVGVALLVWLWSRLLSRWEVSAGLRATLLACVGWSIACWVARVFAVDLPIMEGALALVTASLGRLAITSRSALRTLDEVAVRLGVRAVTTPHSVAVAGRAELVAALAPSMSVAAWTPDGEGKPSLAWRRGEDQHLPVLVTALQQPRTGGTWYVAPFYDGGLPVGWIGVGSLAEVPADVRALVDAVVAAPRDEGEELAPAVDDPLMVRLGRVRAALARAVTRVGRWERLIGEEGMRIGIFGLDGSAVALSEELMRLRDRRDAVPLVGVLRGLTGRDRSELLALVRAAFARSVSPRLAVSGDREVVLTAFGPEHARAGFFLDVVDVGAHRRLDRVKSELLLLAANAMVAGESERIELRQRLKDLATTEPGDDALCPVRLDDALRRAVEALPLTVSQRVELDLRSAPPVVARPAQLARAVTLLITDAVSHAAGAIVQMRRDEDGVVLVITESGGGLPRAMASRLARGDADSAVGQAARLMASMNAELRISDEGGASTGYALRFAPF